MKMIKALLTGARFGIVLERYLNDLVYELDETDRKSNQTQIHYQICVPSNNKKNRLILARSNEISVDICYSNEKVQYFNVYNSNEKVILEIDFVNETFSMRINDEDKEPTKLNFEDMKSPDFLFNFNIEYGVGEGIKEYMQEIDEFISEYGFRQYLQ